MSLKTAGSCGRSAARRRCSSRALPMFGGAGAAAMAVRASNAARAAASEKAVSRMVLLRNVISLVLRELRALAVHRTGLELEGALLFGQPELHLGTAGLGLQGGHLAGEIGPEAVEVEPRRRRRT